MKIAIIADPINNQRAGVHVYTKHLVSFLIDHNQGHEIIIVCEKRIPHLNCHQIIIPNTRLPIGFASLRLFTLVPMALQRAKVDVVIEPAHFGPWNLPVTIKRVTVIHDMTPFLFPQHHRWHSQMLQRLFLKRILNKTDLIITNSDNTSKDVVQIFPETSDKIHRIYLGVDPRYQPTNDRNLIDQLPFNTTSGFFHFVGTLEPRKGIITMIEAYNEFRQQTKQTIPLVICGANGWKTEAIYQTYKDSPYASDIHFLGFVDLELIIQLHSHSFALIYPSTYEGFGFPIVEALSCGGRVITCNNSSLTEVGGQWVSYAQTGDSPSLSQKMIEATANPNHCPEEHHKHLQQHLQKFNWENHARALLELLEKSIPVQNQL